MSKENYKNYFNGGCSTCMFAERDERGRYLGSCSGFSNCSYEEYKGETDITEEEKDEEIADLEAENKRLRSIKEYNEKKLLNKNYKLKQQLALTEKALELACKELDKVEVFDAEFMECDSFYNYFKTKAKEMMKSEFR